MNARAEDPLVALAGLRWPGDGFVRGAGPSGRLAILLAMSLSARVGHSYLGCEHLIAGGLRAGAVTDDEVAEDLRRVAVAAVAASLRLAEVAPADVHAWFEDRSIDDAGVALRSLGPLPTVTPRALRAMRRATAAAAAAGVRVGPGAVHLVAAILEDPGVVGTVAFHEGLPLEAARAWAARRSAWGPLLELLDEL